MGRCRAIDERESGRTAERLGQGATLFLALAAIAMYAFAYAPQRDRAAVLEARARQIRDRLTLLQSRVCRARWQCEELAAGQPEAISEVMRDWMRHAEPGVYSMPDCAPDNRP